MKKTSFLLLFVFLLVISVSYAADTYKPYIHKANLPEHPKIILYGQYRTSLFPGAATYSYGIEVPRGTNGLQPLVFASYNSLMNGMFGVEMGNIRRKYGLSSYSY